MKRITSLVLLASIAWSAIGCVVHTHPEHAHYRHRPVHREPVHREVIVVHRY